MILNPLIGDKSTGNRLLIPLALAAFGGFFNSADGKQTSWGRCGVVFPNRRDLPFAFLFMAAAISPEIRSAARFTGSAARWA